MIFSDVLSVWEIAHRRHSFDPNLSDPHCLPLEVQDSLRILCRGILSGEVALCEEIAGFSSIEGKQIPTMFVVPDETIPPELERCYFERVYEKAVLDKTYVSRGDLFFWSVRYDREFPDFWYTDSLVELVGGTFGTEAPPPPARLRSSQLDKLLCQAIAQTLWAEYPMINISAMARHKSINIYGNGGQYTDEKTVRNWLIEVAPAHLRNKPGRPKKSEPEQR